MNSVVSPVMTPIPEPLPWPAPVPLPLAWVVPLLRLVVLMLGSWEAKLGKSILGMVKLVWIGAVIATTGAGALGTVMLTIAAAPPAGGGGGGEAGLVGIVTPWKAAVLSGAGEAGNIVTWHTA